MSSKRPGVWPRKSAQPLLRLTSSIKIPFVRCRSLCASTFEQKTMCLETRVEKWGFSFSLCLTFPFLLYFIHPEVYTPTFSFLPSRCLSLQFSTHLIPAFFLFWQNLRACPPLSPSSYSSFLSLFFSLCLSCLLAQSLNSLEPRDPVCYVNGLNTDTHVLTYCMYTLMPAHTTPLFTPHAHTHTHTQRLEYMRHEAKAEEKQF